MTSHQFSKELLEQGVETMKEQFRWAMKRLRETEDDSLDQQIAFSIVIRLAQQIAELSELKKTAESESEWIK